MQQDRNFDDLAERFNARIYDTAKGQLRLEILKQD
ncbi:MAG: SAM-dependent methyltransferase, partial [Methylophaga sp.]|nr:SAM-dependent methyltransferase [Methylophaga sp.]